MGNNLFSKYTLAPKQEHLLGLRDSVRNWISGGIWGLTLNRRVSPPLQWLFNSYKTLAGIFFSHWADWECSFLMCQTVKFHLLSLELFFMPFIKSHTVGCTLCNHGYQLPVQFGQLPFLRENFCCHILLAIDHLYEAFLRVYFPYKVEVRW